MRAEIVAFPIDFAPIPRSLLNPSRLGLTAGSVFLGDGLEPLRYDLAVDDNVFTRNEPFRVMPSIRMRRATRPPKLARLALAAHARRRRC